MNYDSYLEAQVDEYLARQDEQHEAYEEQKEYVIRQIQNDEPIIYAEHRQTTADNCDLSDKLYSFQAQLLNAYINNDKDTIFRIVAKCCEQEIDSLVDLIGY